MTKFFLGFNLGFGTCKEQTMVEFTTFFSIKLTSLNNIENLSNSYGCK